MEIALLLSLGLAGSFFVGDKKSKPSSDDENSDYETDESDNEDAYNQHILENSRQQYKNMAEKNFYDSLDGDETNIIPQKYNQIGQYMKNKNFNKKFKTGLLDQFDDAFDNSNDVIYKSSLGEATFGEPSNTNSPFNQYNEIYTPEYFDRPSPVFNDPYGLDVPARRKPTKKNPKSILKKNNYNPQEIAGMNFNEMNFAQLTEGGRFTAGFQREKQYKNPNLPSTGIEAFYEDQMFDAGDIPSAENDVNETSNRSRLALMEREIASDGNWSQYQQNESMTLGVIPDDELTHNNMIPFYKDKGSYGPDSADMNDIKTQKNELFSGRQRDSWRPKDEVRPFFQPVGDMSWAYGTPVRSEENLSRYYSGRYRQNEVLQDPLRVSPGVNLGAHEVGTHGYHSMYRTMPYTVDQLRALNDPKISYAGRIIGEVKGTNRPIQAPVIQYRPDGFKTNTIDDLIPSGNKDLVAPTIRPEYDLPETNRQYQHMEYTGIAGAVDAQVGQNVPEHMRAKIKYSTRQNYKNPEPLQKYSKDQMP